MLVGDQVRLSTPDNTRLNGTTATIKELTDWGAHCIAPAAGSGEFRALWTEMVPLVQQDKVTLHQVPTQTEYTGNVCKRCGSTRLRRAGTCRVCEECGESEGCD